MYVLYIYKYIYKNKKKLDVFLTNNLYCVRVFNIGIKALNQAQMYLDIINVGSKARGGHGVRKRPYVCEAVKLSIKQPHFLAQGNKVSVCVSISTDRYIQE